MVSPKVVQWLHFRNCEGSARKPFYIEIGFGDTHRLGESARLSVRNRIGFGGCHRTPVAMKRGLVFRGGIYALDRGIGPTLDTAEALGLRHNT